MNNKVFTSPLFLSSTATIILVFIVYFYNSHQEKKYDRESKGIIYYFGLSVLVFCLCYGASYLYNNFADTSPKTVADSVMKGGKKIITELKNLTPPSTPKPEVNTNIVEKVLSPKNVMLGGAEDFINTGLPDW